MLYHAASPPTLIGALALGAFLLSARIGLKPPAAKTVPKTSTIHGDTRVDEYSWLRERSNPEVIRYLEEENRYTEAVMKHTEPLQAALYEEMRRRIKETDLSVPEKIDNYFYYQKTVEGQQYPVFCRKRDAQDAPEEIILDQNALAAGHNYFRLGVHQPSPNHRLFAFSTDTNGSETYTLALKDLSTGELLKDQIPETYYGLAWGNDNKTFFYTTLDPAKRPYRLFRHTVGTDPAHDKLVYEEKDEKFFVHISKTRSRKYILLTLESETSSEVRYLSADEPTGEFRVVEPRRPNVEYGVEHHGDRFFIVTNENAKNFKLMDAPVSDPSRRNWKEVIPHREAVKLDGVDAFENHLVIYERENGLRKMRIRNMSTGEIRAVDFPEPVYTFFPATNPEFHTHLLRFNYTSLVTPRSVFDYDMNTGRRELKKQYEVLGGYEPERYQSERVFAQAPDGASVPISLVYKKGLARDGKNPLLLYAYGAYGLSTDPVFSPDRLSLLDRNFIFAIAHVRGGGEMGRSWYENGKLLHKKNTFTDFIACAEHLIAEGYTAKDRLVIYGGSAGGLLIGAVLNMRPELFKIAIAKVPFVDVINTMLDESLPLTVTEFEEWGNPKEKQYYDYMKSYAPYENVAAKAYPHMLVTTGLNDPRVSFWEPAKWVARLRKVKTDENVLLLKTNMGAGHGGASGRYDRLKETAFEYAFILDLLGMGSAAAC
ncbi:MAG TPA: S9 family peptidase [Bryobacterales bacterium]|jgi:oligopeptidase B|nr:S9 family peptidase [Bryobacterales bacterium]